jgi:hypothetical protein
MSQIKKDFNLAGSESSECPSVSALQSVAITINYNLHLNDFANLFIRSARIASPKIPMFKCSKRIMELSARYARDRLLSFAGSPIEQLVARGPISV